MAFEVFTENRAKSTEFISINATQAFGFSRAFLNAYGITKDDKVIILFDEDQNKIALYFTKEDVKYGFSVQVNNKKHGGIVKAKSFFERKSIDTAKCARRYHDFEVVEISSLGFNGKGKAFVLTLDAAAGAEGGNGRTATAVFHDGRG